jgi:hypothetical protein
MSPRACTIKRADSSPRKPKHPKRPPRKEGSKFFLYPCTYCITEKYGVNASQDQVRSFSYTNLQRHHESKHQGLEYFRIRGTEYVQGPDRHILKRPENGLKTEVKLANEIGRKYGLSKGVMKLACPVGFPPPPF